MADNDYALGLIIQTVAQSRFASSTLIISIEDDTWDGVDHADAFRSVVLFAGPYVLRPSRRADFKSLHNSQRRQDDSHSAGHRAARRE